MMDLLVYWQRAGGVVVHLLYLCHVNIHQQAFVVPGLLLHVDAFIADVNIYYCAHRLYM
jgi:hypothetical protein